MSVWLKPSLFCRKFWAYLEDTCDLLTEFLCWGWICICQFGLRNCVMVSLMFVRTMSSMIFRDNTCSVTKARQLRGVRSLLPLCSTSFSKIAIGTKALYKSYRRAMVFPLKQFNLPNEWLFPSTALSSELFGIFGGCLWFADRNCMLRRGLCVSVLVCVCF